MIIHKVLSFVLRCLKISDFILIFFFFFLANYLRNVKKNKKANSLARVLFFRGLCLTKDLKEIQSTDLQWRKLLYSPKLTSSEIVSGINKLSIDNSCLQECKVQFTWKSKPREINFLPLYNELHKTEAKLAFILCLTPSQYLHGKLMLVTAANMYKQKEWPFKKCDAQKLLPIDVNKSCKLWEYFSDFNWI